MGRLATSPFYFVFHRLVGVCHELVFFPIIKRGRNDDDLRGSVVIALILNG
jgi:hypothetical protein